MRLKNILIVVKDIEHSKQFYHDLFGLNTTSCYYSVAFVLVHRVP